MSLARQAAIIICAAFPLLAAPRLTTIQDTIYKADGTMFNGTAVVSWMPFDASDSSKIGLQTLSLRIVNGAVFVQLVPNADATPANNYKVQYSSDGRLQFTEMWSVPSSATPLRIKDVRVLTSSGSTGGGVVQPPTQTPVTEANVIGLLTDLTLRPIRGSSYTAGRAAIVNDNGAIDSATGNPSDCVRVDGSAGPCIDSTLVPSFVDYETPGGVVDGVNPAFTLVNAPNPASSLVLSRNGLALQAVSDYNIQGDGTLLFVASAVPQTGDVLLASYRTGALDSPAPQTLLAPKVQILCSGSGLGTSSTSFTSLGNCVIPKRTLAIGDLVEVRFTFSHQGTANGYNFLVRWGQTTIAQRTGSASDAVVTGRGDISIGPTGTTLDMQTWGSVLSLNSLVASASDPINADIQVDFQAAMNAAGADTVWLQNYTMLRYPAH